MTILREEIRKFKTEIEKAEETMRPIKDLHLMEDLKEKEKEVETAWDIMYGTRDIKKEK